jgi:hypothetical protein
MNVFIRKIGQGKLPPSPSFSARKLCVEDNIGESIHIHVRNVRLELTIEDFIDFSNTVETCLMELRDNEVRG